MLSIPQTPCADKPYRRQITSQNLYTLNLAVFPCCSGIYRFCTIHTRRRYRGNKSGKSQHWDRF